MTAQFLRIAHNTGKAWSRLSQAKSLHLPPETEEAPRRLKSELVADGSSLLYGPGLSPGFSEYVTPYSLRNETGFDILLEDGTGRELCLKHGATLNYQPVKRQPEDLFSLGQAGPGQKQSHSYVRQNPSLLSKVSGSSPALSKVCMVNLLLQDKDYAFAPMRHINLGLMAAKCESAVSEKFNYNFGVLVQPQWEDHKKLLLISSELKITNACDEDMEIYFSGT